MYQINDSFAYLKGNHFICKLLNGISIYKSNHVMRDGLRLLNVGLSLKSYPHPGFSARSLQMF